VEDTKSVEEGVLAVRADTTRAGAALDADQLFGT
jgi:hypothetical protein